MTRGRQHGPTHLPVKEAEYGGHQETLQEERFGSEQNFDGECSRPPASADLVVHQDLHDVHVALEDARVVGFVRQQHELDPQQRDEDEGGSDGPHVQTGLGLVGHPQFGDQNPDDVEQKEEIYLIVRIRHTKKNSSEFGPDNANIVMMINRFIYRQLSYCQNK